MEEPEAPAIRSVLSEPSIARKKEQNLPGISSTAKAREQRDTAGAEELQRLHVEKTQEAAERREAQERAEKEAEKQRLYASERQRALARKQAAEEALDREERARLARRRRERAHAEHVASQRLSAPATQPLAASATAASGEPSKSPSKSLSRSTTPTKLPVLASPRESAGKTRRSADTARRTSPRKVASSPRRRKPRQKRPVEEEMETWEEFLARHDAEEGRRLGKCYLGSNDTPQMHALYRQWRIERAKVARSQHDLAPFSFASSLRS